MGYKRQIAAHSSTILLINSLKKVRIIGVEPTWIAPPDPKSGASANFAISGKYFLPLTSCYYCLCNNTSVNNQIK